MLPTDLPSLRRAIADGATFRYVFFWNHTGQLDPPDESCLSQWAPIGFTVDGIHYPTAEHWMMAGKARLFGDDEILAAILAAPHPRAVKDLGRQVRGFEAETWLSQRRAIVTEGNRHKFEQNAAERAWLQGSGDRVLVEASPVDRIWGIGWAADRPEAADPRRWRGLNVLGFALMDVRTRLAG